MVCKKSLYCLKNGPCVNDSIRKQIWEDNIKFRENFRALNQSDHYWAFQIGKNNCQCTADEFEAFRYPYERRTLSLQKLGNNDCSSITHQQNYSTTGLCPHFSQMNLESDNQLYNESGTRLGCMSETSHSDIPADISLTPLDIRRSILKNPNDPSARRTNRFTASFNSNLNNSFRRGSKIRLTQDETGPICSRYKNELQKLKPNYKVKFASQPNLKKLYAEPKKYVLSNENLKSNKIFLEKLPTKKESSSVPILNNLKVDSKQQNKERENEKKRVKEYLLDDNRNVKQIVITKRSPNKKSYKEKEENNNIKKSEDPIGSAKIPPTTPASIAQPAIKSKLFLHQSLPKPLKKVKRLVSLRLPYTPVTRTTRKLFEQEKQVPFLPFGCNNANSDVGLKRTHNILAADEQEVYPHALFAHKQRRNSIVQFLESEKEFQKSLLPDSIKKKYVNHSSVWMNDFDRKFDKLERETEALKYVKYFPPVKKSGGQVVPTNNQSCKTVNIKQMLSKASRRPSKSSFYSKH